MGDSSLWKQRDQADRSQDVTQPEAELCAIGQECVSAAALDSVEALTVWLQERLPPGESHQIAGWGTLPGTKRVANLLLELAQGEISLEDSKPPKRTVHVATVKIVDGSGRMLLEASQEMADGTFRERNRPLSEKMKPGESVEHACLRGIREELGTEHGSSARVQIMKDSYTRETQERVSFSYPGLMTCYVLHRMVAVMEHLPSTDFSTEENEFCGNAHSEEPSEGCKHIGVLESAESAIIGVRRHFWKWVPEETSDIVQ